MVNLSELDDHGTKAGIQVLTRVCGAGASIERPVFVLGAGWRCGSTLVQRLLCSDNRILVWGEPFEDAIPIARLAHMAAAFADEDVCMPQDTFETLAGEDPARLSSRWIATMHPGVQAFADAHRAFVNEYLAAPAQRRGYQRWGAKWVRLHAGLAHYLRWIYPEARFVCLVRNPFDAYRSYRGHRWHAVNPMAPVEGARSFFEFWTLLAQSFLDEAGELGALILRYEDVVRDSAALRTLGEHCDAEIDASVLGVVLGATKAPQYIPAEDLEIGLEVALPTASRFGYAATSDSGRVSPPDPR